MTALTTAARTAARAGVRDQASRLRALVEAMSGEASACPSSPAALSVPVVAIASGKGGVGKTNLAVNLSIALAARGKRPALLDADLGMANADVLCGITPGRRLDDVLRDEAVGAAALDRCIVEAPGGFLLVPGAVGAARVSELTPRARGRLVEQLALLEARSDIILIDTGAGIGRDVMAFVGACDVLVVVVTPEPTSLTDAYGLLKCLHERSGGTPPSVALVVNEVRRQRDTDEVSARLTACCDRFLGWSPRTLGGVRADPAVAKAVRARVPHAIARPRSAASRDVGEIAGALAAFLARQ